MWYKWKFDRPCGHFEHVSFRLPWFEYLTMFCWTKMDFRLWTERKSHQIQSVAFWPVLNHKGRLKFNIQLCLFDFSPERLTIQQMDRVWRGGAQFLLLTLFSSWICWCCHAHYVAYQRYWGWRWYFQVSHCMISLALVYLKRHISKVCLISSPDYAFWNHNYNDGCH